MSDQPEHAELGYFHKKFSALMGFSPMPWQERLFVRFMTNDLPSGCDIPTGLGKTAVMAIWLLARAAGAPLPRRLVYVVDRRAVVDQATDVAESLRKGIDGDPQVRQALGLRDGRSLPISTLRGQHVDNREWLEDPASLAIIVGTVDMVGSRLLFEGYGVSRKMRPYHAGLLGADSLVLLDEAHLVPPFEHLLAAIDQGEVTFGPRATDRQALVPRFRLLTLSATGRGSTARCHGLTERDLQHEEVKKRLGAKKRLTVLPPPSDPEGWQLAGVLAKEAWKLTENGATPLRCIVFCHKREVAEQTFEEVEGLAKGDKKTGRAKVAIDLELFVGGRRVFEREKAAARLREMGFVAGTAAPPDKPTFLIATSAAEVGVDLDAEHMVSDLVPWERMVQRLGRVNRRGNGNAAIVVVREPERKLPKNVEKALAKPVDQRDEKEKKAVIKYETEIASARSWLEPLGKLPETEDARDASPGAIRKLKLRGEVDKDISQVLLKASTPAPLYPALTRPLVDAWSMTSLKEHTGRPAIDPWLRGWTDDTPQTTIVWRRFLPVRPRGKVKDGEIEAFFEAAPPHASETLETETYRVIEWLEARAKAKTQEGGRDTNAVEEHEPSSASDDEADLEDSDAQYDATDPITDGEKVDQGASDGGNELSDRDPVAFVLSPAGDLRKGMHQGLHLRNLAPLPDKRADSRRRIILERLLPGSTVVVDRRLAGLADTGLLDDYIDGQPLTSDGGVPWDAVRFRVRCVAAGAESVVERDWHERRRFATEISADGEPTSWLIIDKRRHDAATEEDRAQSKPQLLVDHTAMVERRALKIARDLGLPEPYPAVLAVAARLHDDGKKEALWQRAFRARSDGIYGKTKGPVNFALLDGYRHELGSLPAATTELEAAKLPEELRELTLHLIAAHHGFARPVIGTSGCDSSPPSKLEERARDIALRFVRLQKDWGPWGLAWWEALLRAADQQASRENDERQEKP